MRSNGCVSAALTNTLTFPSACVSSSVRVAGAIYPDSPCGANDGGSVWEQRMVPFANSVSVELSLDARMGR